MPVFNKYKPMISTVYIEGEELLNLYELAECIEADEADEAELEFQECIIMPYYISEAGRYELYQYEFIIEQEDGEEFEEYMLRVTGRTKLKDIPDDIFMIRQMCFAKIRENNQGEVLRKIKEYFDFLIHNQCIQNEVVNTFNEFDSNNLFICCY